jgi:beta-lactamase class A
MPMRSWRLQLAAVALAIIAAIVSAQSFASAREAVMTYLIQPGDTLSLIATTTGVSIERLVNLNGIKNADFIVAGETLALVGAPQSQAPAAAESAAGTAHYTVKNGDTLWDISLSTGSSVESLVKLNGLTKPDQLTVGQVLVLSPIANGSTQRAAASSSPQPRAKPTPTPAPTAAPKPKPPAAAPQPSNPLQQKIAAEVLRIGGPNVHVGAAATNLVTGEKVGLHPDDAFPSASVMKLPILVELERQIATGTLSWTESLRAEASAMIAVSDNGAANQIADVIHTQAVNDTMAKLGLGSTRFLNAFTDTRSSSNPGQNQSTPGNMAHLLGLIATDQVVSSQVSADIRTLLSRNVDRSKLARLLPPDARLAHKSGWYEGVANDVGIVTVDRVPTRWVIAVFTEGLPDAETGNQMVAAISKAVYDAWAP